MTFRKTKATRSKRKKRMKKTRTASKKITVPEAAFANSNSPSPLSVKEKKSVVTVENEYIRWEFDRTKGGELTGASVKNGSGENLLRSPQKTMLILYTDDNGYRLFSTVNMPALDSKVRMTPDGGCELRFKQGMADPDGKTLEGVSLEHVTECSAWGYAKHVVRLHFEKRIGDVWSLDVGSFGAAKSFDCCGVREAVERNLIRKWETMHHGTRQDMPVFASERLPVSVLLMERGVEGIEMALGDNLSIWNGTGKHQYFNIGYSAAGQCYNVNFCTLNSSRPGECLEGDFEYEFRMTLPHVKPFVVPFRPGSGNALRRNLPFEERWPGRKELAEWNKNGVTLMRIHNDGDYCDNGIFWRDASFPPYPPDEIAKMNKFLAEARNFRIAVVPYFSMKEYHPESSGYEINSPKWGRNAAGDGRLLLNSVGRHSFFGAQMCLESNWLEHLKSYVDRILSSYAFSGVYYDWCCGIQCWNRAHSRFDHWDNDRVLDLLKWSHDRVGKNGEIYLHMTQCPSLAAENIATLLLTEETGYGDIRPEMFTPHVHFMNIVPRQICDMLGKNSPSDDKRRLALCAVLHHASISSVDPVYLEVYSAPWMKDVSRFRRHTAPGEGIFEISDGAGIAAYWNEKEILVVAANITGKPMKAEWRGRPEQMRLPLTEPLHGTFDLKPFELKTVSIPVVPAR